jgi:predicted permease
MAIFRRIWKLFFQSSLDRRIEFEPKSHIDRQGEDNVAHGLSRKDARRDAVLRFGNPSGTQERATVEDAALTLHSALADMRYSIRQLYQSPGFAATAVLTMALGIGANLAVFQLLYGVMFAHLPVRQPAQIVSIHTIRSPFDGQWFVSYSAYRRLREATLSTSQVFAHSGIGDGVFQSTGASERRIRFQMVSDNFFAVLGISPASGRFFGEGEDSQEESEWPVILGNGFFKEHFGGDRAAIGQRAKLNGVPIVIIGVAPARFNGVVQGDAPDVWLPLAAQATGRFGTWFDSLGPGYGVHLTKPYRTQPSIFWLWAMARVPNAAEPVAAAHWMATLEPDIAMMAAASKDAQVRARVLASHVELVSAENGEGTLSKRYSLPLKILLAMAGVILLVGCLNLANLQMARLLQREREIAIRIALGASRTRVLRQIASESVLLAAIGGPLAFATGRVSSALLLHWASGRGTDIAIDLHIGSAAYLMGISALLGTLVCFGLLPAWLHTRKSFSTAVKSRVGSVPSQGKAGQRWSNLLLASQVSLSLSLVCAAALFAETLRNLSNIDTGMDREHLVSVSLDMRSTGFADQEKNLAAFYGSLIERLKALPEVRDAAVQMCSVPDCGWNTALHVYGKPELAEAQLHGEEDHVGLGYFRTVGIPLLQGRDFTNADNEHSQKVAILNRAYARKLFGDASPIGHWIGYKDDHQFLIVGEVADALVDGLRSAAPPMVYMSIGQGPEPVQTIDVRSRGSLQTLPSEIRESLRALAPALPVTEIVPLDVEFNDGLSTEDLVAQLAGVFGGLTLALAALGFYGLMSFRVARRTSEIGMRMALGATRARVRALFLRQTLGILLAGTIPGAALSFGTAYLTRRLLYGPGAMDVWALGFAVCVLAVVGVLAAIVPAHRAASIDPMQALRNE